MRKVHLNLFQFCSIILLALGYFFTDIPDSLSLMNINPNAALSISKPDQKVNCHAAAITASCSSGEQHGKTTLIPNVLAGYFILPATTTVTLAGVEINTQSLTASREDYNFQFFKEINPPPPKRKADV